MKRFYHVLVILSLSAAFFVLGCSGYTETVNAIGVKGDGGSGGAPECVRTFDPMTGAEIAPTCPQPDPLCGSAYCTDDGKCAIQAFPMGAICGDGMICDGASECVPDITCSKATICTDMPFEAPCCNGSCLGKCYNGHCKTSC